MTDFLTDWGVIIALACAGAAVVYGIGTTRWLLAKSPGNDEMQDISKAVQDGARAWVEVRAGIDLNPVTLQLA